MTYIKHTNDLAFKKAFASENSKDVLAGLITDLMGIVPDDIKYENPYNINDYKVMLENNLRGIFVTNISDIIASIKYADVTIELQVRPMSFYTERSLFYPFSRYLEHYNAAAVGKSEDRRYSTLIPIYSLNILGFSLYPDEDALRVFELYDPIRHKKMKKDLLRLGYFEYNKKNFETENQRFWAEYFSDTHIPDNAPGYIKKAVSTVERVNMKEDERKMIDLLEKARADHDAEIDYAKNEGREEGMEKGIEKGKKEGRKEGREEGKKEGREEGREENKAEMMKRLANMGMDVDFIAKACNSSEREVMRIISTK
jgi:predicted transposase/invertase (TIGR01784 family)